MHPNYPQQQGYGPAQPYGETVPVRANAGASALAGILGVLAAAGLAWVVIEYFTNFDLEPDVWPSEVWIVVAVRGVIALLLILVAGLTLARKVAAAWLLVVLGLLAAATVLLEPLVFGSDIGAWFDELFAFNESVSIAMVAGAGLGLLAAVFAVFAGSMTSGGHQEYRGY